MSSCEAVKYIGDAGYFRLTCDLDTDDHPDLHWDRSYEITWFPWTEQDEAEVKEK